jgi:hypothetical protein
MHVSLLMQLQAVNPGNDKFMTCECSESNFNLFAFYMVHGSSCTWKQCSQNADWQKDTFCAQACLEKDNLGYLLEECRQQMSTRNVKKCQQRMRRDVQLVACCLSYTVQSIDALVLKLKTRLCWPDFKIINSHFYSGAAGIKAEVGSERGGDDGLWSSDCIIGLQYNSNGFSQLGNFFTFSIMK